MKETITITDVALRDGLQNQPFNVPTHVKVRMARMLFEAGLQSLEAASFVSPKAVPQMGDAEEVIRALKGCGRVSGLAPNVRGLERALSANIQEVAVVMSATDTMNRKNLNMSLEETLKASEEVLRVARANGVDTRAYVAVAFECPFEGLTPSERVFDLCDALLEAGAQEVVIADTIGAAAPGQVSSLLSGLKGRVPQDMLAVHFHDTRGMGVANAWAALEAGVRRFDSSVGGIGGCPFAPGAAGNLATEDLVLMAEQSGFSTGVDLAKLLGVLDYAEEQLGRTLGGNSSRWLRQQKARLGSDPVRGLTP
ncbi:hydroxymethylglutaryl-CoA lyase [Parapusillimonas sp. JC17]|uniref:hydroxymethylglutaryl-CoA lyase n=1 Tax=Parapusillimonas sp. JC17 TaxID=3445768 RepID=UPI003FA05444